MSDDFIYAIETVTGDVSGAGTDANVYVTIYGTHGTLGEMPLKTPGDPFERGKIDHFVASGVHIGTPQRVRVRHDNTGSRPGWFLQEVRLLDGWGTNTYGVAHCNAWLATDEGGIDKTFVFDEARPCFS